VYIYIFMYVCIYIYLCIYAYICIMSPVPSPFPSCWFFSRMTEPLCTIIFLPAVYERPSFFPASPAFERHSDWHAVILHAGFYLASIMTSETMSSSLMTYLHVFCSFSRWIVWYCWDFRFLYTLSKCDLQVPHWSKYQSGASLLSLSS
jgi:hypothetical protein